MYFNLQHTCLKLCKDLQIVYISVKLVQCPIRINQNNQSAFLVYNFQIRYCSVFIKHATVIIPHQLI